MAKLSISRVVIALAVGAVVVAAAVPIVAFGIVPLLVRSTAHEAPPSPAVTTFPASAAASPTVTDVAPAVVASGMLRRVDAVHYGSGRVIILDLAGAHYLRFDGVAIAGAPNMYVYLSDRTDGQPGTFTDLGPLKATDGSFNYPLPGGVDISTVRSVVVWCRAFSVTVTFADLVRP